MCPIIGDNNENTFLAKGCNPLNKGVFASLYGLVLGGGKSMRMGMDKMTLKYGDKTESERCFELLSRWSEKVFISNRMEQSQAPSHAGFPQIHDIQEGLGPLGGIISAMTTYPDVAWLVVGCDMPYVDNEVINCLISRRNPKKLATAFLNLDVNLPDPLCAIYEPSCYAIFKASLNKGELSPQQFLADADIELISVKDSSFLQSINTQEEYKKVRVL